MSYAKGTWLRYISCVTLECFGTQYDQNVNKLLGAYSAGNGLSKSIQLYLGSRCILPVGSCHFVQVCPLVGGCSLGYTVCVRDGLDESVYPGPKGF